jgi:glycosyltransferase involved in cell wall biosynthesis
MKISLVVPVFNEEEAIPIFYKTVREFEDLQQHEVEIVFINDGSKDATESIINALAVADPLVIPLSFTRNFEKSLRYLRVLTMRPVTRLSRLTWTCKTRLRLFHT